MNFWHFYLNEHANARNRAMHLVGTSIAFGLLLGAIALQNPWYLLAALLAGYAFAWIGHLVFEKNRPATFRHPLKSFASDWRMWGLFLAGRLNRHIERASNDS